MASSPRRVSMWARRVDQRWFSRGSTPTISRIGRFVGSVPGRSANRTPNDLAEVLLQRGVVGLRRGNVGLEQHPAVDGQPASVEGLHLVRDRDMGVQIRVAGPAVAVGERGRDQAADVDLPDPLRPGPGEQGMLLNERQRVLHGGLMGAFDDGRNGRFGDRPQGRDLTSPGRTSGHNQQPSGFAAAKSFAICPASSRASIGSRPCSARKNSRATSVRTRARSEAGRAAPAGRPAAVWIAAKRLATSRRNGLTSPSTILNGAPSLAASW